MLPSDIILKEHMKADHNSASHEDFDVSQILKDFEAYSNN